MVDVQRGAPRADWQIVLRPNRSISWRGTLWFFLGLCLISGTIATTLAVLGFWLVIPFAGLEMLAVGTGLYVVACRCHQCEVILISAERVRVEKGRRHPHRIWDFNRVWAQVVVERCPNGWYPSRLLIRSHGRAVEIGGFLSEQERQRLATELVRVLRLPGCVVATDLPKNS